MHYQIGSPSLDNGRKSAYTKSIQLFSQISKMFVLYSDSFFLKPILDAHSMK